LRRSTTLALSTRPWASVGQRSAAAVADCTAALDGGGAVDMATWAAARLLSAAAAGGNGSSTRYAPLQWPLASRGKGGGSGDDALGKANAGIAPQATIISVSMYRHTRQVQRWKRDGLNAGDPIVTRIDAGRLLGHRTDRG
jgi:hypothetical protein